MSPASSNSDSDGPYRKPQADIYTVLLVIALLAVLIGIGCLYFELDAYEFDDGQARLAADPPSALAVASVSWPLNPTLSTDAPTTSRLLPLRSSG